MSDLGELLARLEAASEGSQLLDIEVARALGWTCLAEHQDNDHTRMAVRMAHELGDWFGLNWNDADGRPKGDCREWPFTTSLECALTLVPSGLWWTVAAGKTEPREPLFGAAIYQPEYTSEPVPIAAGEHPTSAAIALCIAALRASASLPPTTEGENG